MLWFRVCAVEFDVTILAADSTGMVCEVFVATCSGVWSVANGTCFCIGVGWCSIGVVVHEICFAILARRFAFAFASFRLVGLKVRMLHRRRRVEAIKGSIWVEVGSHAILSFSPCHLRSGGSVVLMKLESSFQQVHVTDGSELRRRKISSRSFSISPAMTVIGIFAAVRRCSSSAGFAA